MKETIKKKINKDERKIKIILGIMLILFVLTLASFVMLITKLFEKKEDPKVPYVKGIEKNEKLVERLKGKSEYARMKIYLGDIVKKLNVVVVEEKISGITKYISRNISNIFRAK